MKGNWETALVRGVRGVRVALVLCVCPVCGVGVQGVGIILKKKGLNKPGLV